MSHIRRQRGFSIIEVLVALLVMTFGILGVTALQSASLAHNTQSMYRTKAAYLSYEILDRMRANPGQDYAVALDTEPASQLCFADSCSAAEMMAFDISEWKCSLGKYVATDACVALSGDPAALLQATEALPGGDGSVTCATNNATKIKTCTVTVTWQERGDTVNSATQVRTFQLSSTI